MQCEMVMHFLFECPAHVHECICYFCQWQRKECDLSFLLSEPKAALSVIGFVRDTERLTAVFGQLHDRS